MIKETESIQGMVENVVFHNNETGFTVMEIDFEGEILTVVGEILSIGEGEEIKAYGNFSEHHTYGRQFKATAFEQILPATASAILKYLAGGAVKGIGPVYAKKIVLKFGVETLRILEENPIEISSIKGISSKKALEIGEEYRRLLGIRSVMLFLSSHGVDPSTTILVWKKWGASAQPIITLDPYCLCAEDIAVPFEKAEEIARELGVDANAMCRIKGGVIYVLFHNLSNGHSCLPIDKLLLTTAKLLDIASEQVENAMDELRENGEVVLDTIFNGDYLYLPIQYNCESYCADRLKLLVSFAGKDNPVSDNEIENLQKELEINYAEKQINALKASVFHPVMILTGGPGTGKTTTLNGIITLFERRGMKVLLAAPTGRAAKRLAEVTSRDAKTIHRLLEVDFGCDVSNPKFKRNEKNPLPADVIIVDEMSMVDVKLFASLLKALKMDSRLLMVGDPDQLPSVGAGNVLRDLLESDFIHSIHLDEVFRQAAQSLIVTSAHKIVNGEMPSLAVTESDLFFLARDSMEQVATTVVDLISRRLPKAYGFSPFTDIQTLIPTKQGAAGTIELNRQLQQALNPPQKGKTEYRLKTILFREGDKVMQIKNNYDLMWQKEDGEEGLGVYNGDIGYIQMIDNPSRTVKVKFDDKTVIYSFDNFNELELAYAITIHKSQGNEFDAVVIPLVGNHRRLHYRNLLYTAVTRARKILILVGQRDTIMRMVSNDKKTLRYTNLAQRLKIYEN